MEVTLKCGLKKENSNKKKQKDKQINQYNFKSSRRLKDTISKK